MEQKQQQRPGHTSQLCLFSQSSGFHAGCQEYINLNNLFGQSGGGRLKRRARSSTVLVDHNGKGDFRISVIIHWVVVLADSLLHKLNDYCSIDFRLLIYFIQADIMSVYYLTRKQLR